MFPDGDRHYTEEEEQEAIEAHITKYGKHSVIPILTSYGCPYNCSFCVEKVLHPKYFEKAAHDVLMMIEEALSLRPQLINFIDDNFLLNRKRVREILSLCQQKNLRFRFVCTGRVDEVLSLNDETMMLVKKGGLVGIFFGIESGSSRILKFINKRITPEMVL